MKYFIDTEFIEGPQKEPFPISLFRKETPPTIDLISIGIVSEDNREFYEISKDFNLKEAWNRYQLIPKPSAGMVQIKVTKKVYWLRENVLKPIWRELFFKADDCTGLSNYQTETFYQEVMKGDYDKYFTFKSLKLLIEKYGKTNKEITEGITQFIYRTHTKNELEFTTDNAKISFYAYYADYDWVVFCWLFGKMIDLPEGFPKYCNDLKQTMNELDIKSQMNGFKKLDKYPQKENEHNAIEDARWNKQLYEFLNQL